MRAALRLVEHNGYPPTLINAEVEGALLGALMINNALIDIVAERVGVDDFVLPGHQTIYAVILSEAAAGRAASPPLLRNHLMGDPDVEELGGWTYLVNLVGNSGILVGAMDFVHTVSDLAKRRRLYDEMQLLSADLAAVTGDPVETLVESIDNALAGALQRQQTTQSMTIAKAFDRTLQGIDDEAAGLGPQGIKIDGLDDFNSLTGDMRRGEVIVIGGRPSMGKTALALGITLGAARGGAGTLLISLEMRTEELMARAITDLIFEYGNSPTFSQVRKGIFTGFDRERLALARETIDKWPLIITDPPSLSIGRLSMMIRRYQRQMAAKGQALDMVVIDYLGLIRGTDKRAKRYEEVGEISRVLKQVAKECNVALIVLAQLNRETEKREDKRPQLSDLRDAGDIEQDADMVLFVYREQYYLERSEPEVDHKSRGQWEINMAAERDRMDIILAKARNGEVSRRKLYFFGKYQAVRGSKFMSELHQ